MKKQNVAAKILTALLMAVSSAPAMATMDPVWSGNVNHARYAAKVAMDGIEKHSKNCRGLKGLLVLGASRPRKKKFKPGTLDEVRMQLMTINLLAAQMQFMSEYGSDPAAEYAYQQIAEVRDEVIDLVKAKVEYCGNGIERAPVR